MSLASIATRMVPPAALPAERQPRADVGAQDAVAPDGAVPIPAGQAPAAAGGPARQPAPSGFELLTHYLPTETMTLYIGAMAARTEIAALLKTDPGTPWVIYWVFALLTPLILVAIAFGNFRRDGSRGTFSLPWWPVVASCIAFLMWGLSVPGNPVADATSGLPAFGALLVSTLLGLAEPAFAGGRTKKGGEA